MKGGALDRQIVLQHCVIAAADMNGSKVQTFTTYATVWTEKLDAGGREYFAGQQVQGELATRFKIRYRTDVLATDRLTFEGKSYNIKHTQELGRREGLMLFATTVENG